VTGVQTCALPILSFNGVEDRMKIKQCIAKLPARDTATIREVLRQAPGIDTNISINCPICKTEMKIDLPITESFFRPTEQRGIGV